MKKHFNQLLSLILVILMIIPMISAMGFTASAESYSGTCGDNLKWTLNTSTGVLDITGIGSMTDYSYSSFSSIPWYSYSSYIKTVNISSGVTSIGGSAFRDCTGLTSITIPDSVTTIGRNAFFCAGLKSVTIGNSVTSIGSNAFNKTALYNDNSNWENNALYISNHLIEVKASVSGSYLIKEGTLTIADSAFSECTGLKSVTIPDSVTSIGRSAFVGGTGLLRIDVDENNEYYSNDDYGVLYNKDKTKLVQYPAGSNLSVYRILDNVTSIGDYAFCGCSGLTSITIPDSVMSIGDDAFECCTGLTSITIPDGVTSIGNYAFHSCTNLTSITIPDSVTGIGTSAFRYCSSLTSVTIPNRVTSIGDSVFEYCTGLTRVTIPDGVTSIGDNAFGSTGLTSVTIPDSVTSIGSYAFSGYKKITIKCYEGSYADTYAKNNSIPVEYLCKHVFINYISDNNYTCLEDGTKTAYCDNGCGEMDTIIDIGSKAHNYEITVLREATCSKAGLAMYMCGICSDYYTASIPTVEHIYTNYISDNNATCTDNGTKTARCDYGCGATDTIVDEGTIIEHKFTNYISDKNGSCIKDGTKTAYCDYGCGTTDTVTDTGYKPHNYTEEIIEEASCTEEGTKLCICTLCKDFYVDILPTVEHIGEWVVTAKPTTENDGENTFTCSVCGNTETVSIPKLDIPSISAENYDVFVTSADYITYIRYAKGEYTTASEIKNAEDCVTLNASKIASYTKDNVCALAMADGGVYSFWIKLNDGSEYIYKVDLSVMTQEVVADGVTVTVKNLYGVKDYFIAKGSHTTYSDVKANSVVQITKNKIGTKHDYKYILSAPGTYTVCIRYDDVNRANEFITFEVVVTEPTFTPNGLQLTVGNLEGVKVIRTAYGEYNTPGEIKRAEGSRAFTASTIAKSGDEYTIQYRENGVVTVAVVYNNGYEVIYKYDVAMKSPIMTQEENRVTFTDLCDLKVIRYAMGEYSTSNQIKNAKGSVSISASKITDDKYSVTLTKGTYTFCVQYNDESYNYYVVTVE